MQVGVWLDRPKRGDVSYPEFLDEVLRAETAPAMAAGATGVPRSIVASAAAIRCAMKARSLQQSDASALLLALGEKKTTSRAFSI
jgi:hypothetical protein